MCRCCTQRSGSVTGVKALQRSARRTSLHLSPLPEETDQSAHFCCCDSPSLGSSVARGGRPVFESQLWNQSMCNEFRRIFLGNEDLRFPRQWLWSVTSCSLTNLCTNALKMETVSSSETGLHGILPHFRLRTQSCDFNDASKERM